MTRQTTERATASGDGVLERRFRSEAAAVGASRRSLDLIAAPLHRSVLENAKLLTSELTSNAVRHGPGRPGAEVTLRAALHGDALRVEVSDEGSGFRPPEPNGVLDVGGWGLVLVDRVADRWGVQPGSPTTVWFELDDATHDGAASTWPQNFDPLLLDALPAAVIATDLDGVITRWNRHAEVLFGFDADEVIGQNVTAILVAEGDEADAESIMERVREGGAWEGEWLAPRRDGAPIWVRIANTSVRDERGVPIGMVGVSVDIESERAAREQVEKAHERVAFLAEASMLLSSSLDLGRTLSKIARLVVPRMADWCSIKMLAPDGTIESAVVHHPELDKVALAREYERRYPATRDDPGGAGLSIRSGEPQLYPEITPDMLEEAIPDPDQRRILLELGLRSAMVVPLEARGRALGAITFASSESGRSFDAQDLELAHDLARRAALAIDNARLYEERSHIARTLQRSLLPRRLPEIEWLEVAAIYQPAGIMRTEVGGDFYDVFEAGEGAWGVVVGDVCGKGVEAAALTGMARHTIRGSTLRQASPRGALEDLNRVMLREDGERFCTVALGRVETNEKAARLTVACGGHPLPFVLRRRGKIETVGSPGSLLGVFEDVSIEDRSTVLKSGDLAVFFTDGLVDVRHPTPLDDGALRALVQACAGRSAQETVDRIAEAVADPGGQAPDDICVVVLRVAE